MYFSFHCVLHVSSHSPSFTYCHNLGEIRHYQFAQSSCYFLLFRSTTPPPPVTKQSQMNFSYNAACMADLHTSDTVVITCCTLLRVISASAKYPEELHLLVIVLLM